MQMGIYCLALLTVQLSMWVGLLGPLERVVNVVQPGYLDKLDRMALRCCLGPERLRKTME